MPSYRFEFRENFAKEVLENIELESDKAATAEAIRTAREILAEGVLEGLDRTGWAVRVYDDQDRRVATIEFSQLIEKRGNLK